MIDVMYIFNGACGPGSKGKRHERVCTVYRKLPIVINVLSRCIAGAANRVGRGRQAERARFVSAGTCEQRALKLAKAAENWRSDNARFVAVLSGVFEKI